MTSSNNGPIRLLPTKDNYYLLKPPVAGYKFNRSCAGPEGASPVWWAKIDA